MNSTIKNENLIVDSYNKNMKMLVTIMKSKLNNDKNVDAISNKIRCALQFDVLTLIRESGPYFIKYKDQIKKKDMEFFLNKDNWEDDIGDADNSDAELSHDIINKIKNLWFDLNDKEKNALYDLTDKLLTDYSRYLILKLQ